MWEVTVDDVQQTMEVAMCSKRQRRRRTANNARAAAEMAAVCGDGSSMRRACGGGVRWRRRSSGLGQVRMERDISFISRSCQLIVDVVKC